MLPSLHRSSLLVLALTCAPLLLVAPACLPDFIGGDDDDDDEEEDAECGNGDAERGEGCDGEDLRSATCESEGFGEGTLTCLGTCSDYDRQGCGAPDGCGDDDRAGVEVCDGADVDGETCESQGYGPGVLRCANNCGNFDVTACAPPEGCVPECGDRVCGLDPACGTPCGTCGNGFACSDGACEVIPRCTNEDDLVSICEGGVCSLDLDVPLFAIDTQLEIDGQPPVNISFDYAETSARFTDTSTGVAYSFGFDATGGRETLLVPAGTYDVDIFVNDERGAPGAPTNVPLRAEENVLVSVDGDLDLDVALFAVDTLLEIDGQPPVNISFDYAETSARFTDRATAVAYFFGYDAVGGRETLLVPAGTYDVDIFVNDERGAPGAPTNVSLRAAANVGVAADRNLDLDVALFAVDTLLEIDGQPPVNISFDYAEASARFTDTDTGVAYSFGYDAVGGRETLLVPAGTYDVDLFVNDERGAPGAPTNVSLRASADVSIDADRDLDLDVALFAIDTLIEIDGQPPVNISFDYAETSARFTDTDTGVAYSFGYDAVGGRETLLVPAGTYDVDLFVNDERGAPGAPTNVSLRASADVNVDADRDLDLDVALFAVDTLLEIDGQPPVNISFDYAETSARFTDVDTGVAYSFGYDAVGGRETLLVPAGTYDVDLFVNDERGAPGAPANVSLRASADVVIAADRDLDLDIGLFDVATLLHVDGQQPVNISFDYAETSARFIDVATGVAYSFGYDAVGGRETFLVPAGTYDVDVFVNDERGVPGAPTNVPLRAAQCVVVD